MTVTLPLITLHLTERCNSRCVSCDYWRHGTEDVSVDAVQALLPGLRELRTHTILISGGEPLLHREWQRIAAMLRENGQELWLLTSGLSLAKHATRAAALFRSITVSLDGSDAAMYAAIRGVDAFDKVCEGIRAAVLAGAPVSLRVTLQRANYRAMPALVRLARELGVVQISFLPADVANGVAFGRSGDFSTGMALGPDDLPVFAAVLDALERDHAEDFRRSFIAEQPAKLRRILQYYTAVAGLGPYPPTRCNAPEFSAVVEANGRVNPCFFIRGPAPSRPLAELALSVDDPAMRALREAVRDGKRAECITCVCSMWRNPREFDSLRFQLERRVADAEHAA